MPASPIFVSAQSVDTITTFTLPAIPRVLQTPDSRAAYLVEHYWQNVNFRDTNYVHHPEIVEQAAVNYIDILTLVPSELAEASLTALIRRTEAARACFDYITRLMELYLYEADSPMKNEEFYIPVLRAMISSSLLTDAEKIRPRERLRLVLRNRVGTPAQDFVYTLPDGTRGRLHQVSAPFLILYIHNPGCHTCSETTAALRTLPTVNRLLTQGRLKVLSIYPDEEVDEWRRSLYRLPTRWINAYDADQTITKKNLYDLKAIPTLYLLDSEKRVVLKDVTPQHIEEFLSNQNRK